MHALSRIVCALLFAAAAIPSARAASFNCAAAIAPAEKLVCGDATLSSLDDQLAAAYAAAAAVAPRTDDLRARQRHWISHTRDKAADVMALRDAYQNRIAALRAEADAARAIRAPFDADALNHRCVKLRDEADEVCAIEASGAVAGDRSGTLLYQQQSYKDGTLRVAGGLVVLQRQAWGQLLPLLWDATEEAWYGAPAIIASPSGPLLQMPGNLDGTGNISIESLYREVDGRWQEIDIESWREALGRRLPQGLAIWKGMYPDWTKMTVETSLWRHADANCCPTGGSVRATLALRGNRIVLVDMRLSPHPLP